MTRSGEQRSEESEVVNAHGALAPGHERSGYPNTCFYAGRSPREVKANHLCQRAGECVLHRRRDVERLEALEGGALSEASPSYREKFVGLSTTI